jgi:putative membrane protein
MSVMPPTPPHPASGGAADSRTAIITHVLRDWNHRVLREWFDPRELRQVGETPDYRFSLANERTFLAWIRTGLALVGGGLACAQFLRPLAVPHLRELLALALVLLGGVVAVRAIDRWARAERAIRLRQDLPASRFPAVLALLVAAGALLLTAALLVQAFR